MIKLRVLGTGCPSCRGLEQIVNELVENEWKDWEIDFRYVDGNEGMRRIMELGVMHSPVVTLNGEVIMVGSFNTKEKVRQKIEPFIREIIGDEE